jgi:hypothetical protein
MKSFNCFWFSHFLLFSNFQTGAIFTDVATVKSQFSAVPPSNEQMQKLLRLLHEVLLAGKKSEEASAVIIIFKRINLSGAK